MTVDYREAYGLYASNGILFNHESPRRGETFVTRKMTRAVRHHSGDCRSTCSWATSMPSAIGATPPDYVEAMWLMLQQHEPDDYVVATGEMHSVRELCEIAFGFVGLDWERYVRLDERYFRPTEVDTLCGDASKASRVLGWTPKTSFDQLVRMMLDRDLVDLGLTATTTATR